MRSIVLKSSNNYSIFELCKTPWVIRKQADNRRIPLLFQKTPPFLDSPQWIQLLASKPSTLLAGESSFSLILSPIFIAISFLSTSPFFISNPRYLYVNTSSQVCPGELGNRRFDFQLHGTFLLIDDHPNGGSVSLHSLADCLSTLDVRCGRFQNVHEIDDFDIIAIPSS